MKKIISGLLIGALLPLYPIVAHASESTLISGQFIDSSGAPLADTYYRFTFSDGQSATGKSDTFGKFIVSGVQGPYKFSLPYYGLSSCISTNFQGNFDEAFEKFELRFPKPTKYILKTVDSKNRPVFGSSWNFRSVTFKSPLNEQFGSPKFKACDHGIYSRGSSPSKPDAEISAFEIDVDETLRDLNASGQINGRIYGTYLDSISSQKSLSISISDLRSESPTLMVPALPTIEISRPKQTKKIVQVSALLSESSIYSGYSIPRNVQVFWRWKLTGSKAKWKNWRTEPIAAVGETGKIDLKINLRELGASIPGSSIELRIIGNGFGSMSEVRALRLK